MRFIQVYISLIAITASVLNISGWNNDSKNENATKDNEGITEVPNNGAQYSKKKTKTDQQKQQEASDEEESDEKEGTAPGVSPNGVGNPAGEVKKTGRFRNALKTATAKASSIKEYVKRKVGGGNPKKGK